MGPFIFLNGAFLVGLAAAALPILIHLFSRRRAVERPFSNLRFLDEITRRRIRRMRLRQWLLLAMRTLAVALIALALSRPVWHGPGAQKQRGSATVAILIDDSYSMEARLDPSSVLPVQDGDPGQRSLTRFEQARQRALAIVDLLGEGDRAILVFTAAPLKVPYESTVRDPALLREEIERAQPRASRSDLVAALERVRPVLASAKTLNREIFVISDLQDNQMQAILRDLSTRAQGRRAPPSDEREEAPPPADTSRIVLAARVPVPEETRLYLIPATGPIGPNVAVVWAFFERDPSGSGGRISVRVRNSGDTPIHEGLLQVYAGDGQALLAEGFVTVGPGEQVQTVLSVPEVPPDELLAVRSGPDILARDNVRYLSASATSRFRVLMVTGGPLSDPRVRAEATFPILALDPWGGSVLLADDEEAGAPIAEWMEERARGNRLFEVEVVAESDLGLMSAIEADAVILLNVGRLSAAAAELLERHRAGGRGILIALGDRVDPRIYNTQILPRLGEVRLENIVGDLRSTTYFSLRHAAAAHEIYTGVPIAPGEALSSAQFRRLLELRTGEGSRVLAEFSGNRAALVEEPGLLLFASSLDMGWSDFPTSASYLPFLHRALLHLILRGRIGHREPVVGEPLSHPLPAELAGQTFRCAGPAGIRLPVEIAQTERGALLRSDPVAEPGFYHLGAELPTFAVNVDTRESELATLSREDGELIFGSEAIWLAPDEEISRQVLQARYGRELWRLCLILAFLLLLGESLLARGRIRP